MGGAGILVQHYQNHANSDAEFGDVPDFAIEDKVWPEFLHPERHGKDHAPGHQPGGHGVQGYCPLPAVAPEIDCDDDEHLRQQSEDDDFRLSVEDSVEHPYACDEAEHGNDGPGQRTKAALFPGREKNGEQLPCCNGSRQRPENRQRHGRQVNAEEGGDGKQETKAKGDWTAFFQDHGRDSKEDGSESQRV